ncbi:MAG: hypothetical protein LBD45_09540, partial [Bacteroidales bacterium]|jgi:hypothetical protein|nr:hypothetical protein [Bacteroidales bacterium]
MLSAMIPNWIHAINKTLYHILTAFLGKSRAAVTLIAMLIGFPVYKWDFFFGSTTNAIVIVLQFISSITDAVASKLYLFISAA